MAKKKLSELTGQQVVQYYDPSGPQAGDMFWSMASSRSGCYIADGTDYLASSEPELFLAIGNTFNTQINPTTGAAWATPTAGRFRVPDMRGVVPRGAGTPINGSALGVGEFQDDQMQAHRHQLSYYNTGGGAAQYLPDYNQTVSKSATPSNTFNTSGIISDAGYSTARFGNETRGKARGGNWFIRRFNPTAVSYNGGMATPLVPGMMGPRTPELDLSSLVTSSVAFVGVTARGIAYSDRLGKWRLNFSVSSSVAAGSRLGITLTFSGVTFPAFEQACPTFVTGPSGFTASGGLSGANSGLIPIQHLTSNTQYYFASGDLALAGKPAWA